MNACPVCKSTLVEQRSVLWPELIREWGLNTEEVNIIERQQGLQCMKCKCNMREMSLRNAIMSFRGRLGPREFDNVLDINGCGLSSHIEGWSKNYVRADFPRVDMQMLPFADETFDLVVHSDTLEHVPDPIMGLLECKRCLQHGAPVIFTVPMLPTRLTRSRAGMPASYHGGPHRPADNLVHTEYGADAWTHLARAGFDDVRTYIFEYPAGVALCGVK